MFKKKKIAILKAISELPLEKRCGRYIGKEAKVSRGMIYPLLLELESEGLVWHEAFSPVYDQQGKRFFYELTALGQHTVNQPSTYKGPEIQIHWGCLTTILFVILFWVSICLMLI